MKICLISDLHLSSNPRVWKEAKILSANGYDVTILTVFTDGERKKKDLKILEGYPIKYVGGINLIKEEVSVFKRFSYRTMAKFSKLVKQFLKMDTPWILGFSPSEMLEKAAAENADLYIAHTEYGMYIGNKLIERNKKVGYDFEDWYSHDYIVPFRPVSLLKRIEKFALETGAFCFCPSIAMAKGIQQQTGCNNKIDVIYNGFSINEKNLKTADVVKKSNSLIWFSQTIGAGRGIETMIEALQFLDEKIEFHLLGNIDDDYKNSLIDLFSDKNGNQLIFHPTVNHNELLGFLSQFSIGLALEQNYPESRDTTITNKILQYVQAGIKVLATDTKGQLEVATYFPELVEIVELKDPKDWARGVAKLLNTPSVNEDITDQKFSEIFSLEAQEKKILAAVSKALQN
ncbi:MAG: glycosyltransferase [Bacteroidota bacterium]